jgi:hypothetical protein
MDQGSLVKEQINAGNRFLREFDKYAPAVVAFWLKDSENDRWALYVASDRIDDTNFDVAYGEVIRIAGEIGDPNFDPFQVRVLRMGDPMVKAALAAYMDRPPKIPFTVRGANFEGIGAEEVYLVRGPIGGYSMPTSTGRDTLNQIIDKEAEFFEQHGKAPEKIKLPVLMAYDLAKCGREELGELAGRIFKDGIVILEQGGFHGMKVEIIRKRDAVLELE